MKKLLFVLVALLIATPAMALTIQATDEGSGVVRLDYIRAAGEQRVRAFGLDVTITAGNAVYSTINNFGTGESSPSNKKFGIFPGTIVIDSTGTVTAPGNPKAPAGAPGVSTTGITLELGSLYKGDANSPAPGTAAATVMLCKLVYTGTGVSTLAIAANSTRGGVVNEDGTAAAPTYTGTTISFSVAECLKATAPEYAAWAAVGKPACWCNKRQCRGDINGVKTGPYSVQQLDLDIFRAAFNKSDTVITGQVPNGYCADLNHTKTGPYRVQQLDLDQFRLYFNKNDTIVTICPSTNINFWNN